MMQAGWARLHRLVYRMKSCVIRRLLQLIGGVVAGVEQQFSVVVHIGEHGLAQEGRTILLLS